MATDIVGVGGEVEAVAVVVGSGVLVVDVVGDGVLAELRVGLYVGVLRVGVVVIGWVPVEVLTALPVGLTVDVWKVVVAVWWVKDDVCVQTLLTSGMGVMSDAMQLYSPNSLPPPRGETKHRFSLM